MFSVEKLTDSAYKFANKAAQVSCDLAVMGKEKADVLVLEAKLSKAQRQLGAIVYSLHRNGAKDDELVAKYIAAVDKIEKQLEAHGVKAPKAAETDAKTTVICPDCGMEVDKDAIFCPGCGVKLS